jgi:predicted alpha/beta-fold hydrolase
MESVAWLDKYTTIFRPDVRSLEQGSKCLPRSGLFKGLAPLLFLILHRVLGVVSFMFLSFDTALIFCFILSIGNYLMSETSNGTVGILQGLPLTRFQYRVKNSLGHFSSYTTPWWCYNSHVSTCLPLILNNYPPKTLLRQSLIASDGASIGLDWHVPDTDLSGVVMVVPGLNGTSHGGYVQDLMSRMGKAGYACAVMHGRGAGKTLVESVETAFHLGRSSDLLVCLEGIESVIPNKELPIFILGYSAGAIRAVKFAAVYGDTIESRVKAVLSFGGSLRNSSTMGSRTSSCVYQPVITHAYASTMYSKLAGFGKQGLDLESMFTSRSFDTFRDFDIHVTSVIHNMPVEEYEREVFPYHDERWKDISVPTLIVNSVDDPVLHYADAVIPEMAVGNSNITFLVTEKGGHIGWPTGWCKNTHGYRWISDVALTFISTCLDNSL